MSRRKSARRFEPRYGVSQAALDVEAGYLAREIEDYQLLAQSDLEAKRTKRHTECEHAWKHLNLLLASVSEKEQRIIHTLLFRDLHLVVELYLTHLRSRQPEMSSPAKPVSASKQSEPSPFSEWLFNPT